MTHQNKIEEDKVNARVENIFSGVSDYSPISGEM
jgi:hypothetical protein